MQLKALRVVIALALAGTFASAEPGLYSPNAYRGETFSRVLTWRDSSGALVNLAGYSAKIQIRDTVGNTVLDEFSVGTGLTLGEALGTITWQMTAAQNYGGGRVGYTVYATDATDSQSLVGDVRFAMVNKAGTETCAVGEVGTPVLAESAGGSTLTCAFTCATAAADTVDLSANCTSSLTQTTFTIEHRGDMQKTNTWTPQ